jgi:hypothetical protein
MENGSAKKIITEALYKVTTEKSKKNSALSMLSEALNNKEKITKFNDMSSKNNDIEAHNSIYNENHEYFKEIIAISKDNTNESKKNDFEMKKLLSDFAKNSENIDNIITSYEQEKSKALLTFDIVKAAEIDKKINILRNGNFKLNKEENTYKD